MTDLPFKEFASDKENEVIRIFDPKDAEEDDYVWHRDKEDRFVTVIEGEGWRFQLDNELPEEINKGDSFFIKNMTYHRIIPGRNNLVIAIRKEDKCQA